jgi:hypothetical protein
MVAPMLASHNLFVMAVATSFAIADRYALLTYLQHLLRARFAPALPGFSSPLTKAAA